MEFLLMKPLIAIKYQTEIKSLNTEQLDLFKVREFHK